MITIVPGYPSHTDALHELQKRCCEEGMSFLAISDQGHQDQTTFQSRQPTGAEELRGSWWMRYWRVRAHQ